MSTDHGVSQHTPDAGGSSGRSDRTRPDHGRRRRLIRAAVIGSLIVWVTFAAIMMSGRNGLLDNDLLGNFYDAQARSILHGHLDVPPEVPGFEGFVMDGRTYIYQGIFPSLVRLPLLAVTSSLDGRLTGISLLAAEAVLLGYLGHAVLSVLGRRRSTRSDTLVDGITVAATIVAVGSGPTLFFASRAWVYHEAALWGAALCLGSLVHLGRWFQRTTGAEKPHSRRSPDWHLVAAAALGAAALNTRVSIGGGAVAALMATGMVAAFRLVRSKDPGRHGIRSWAAPGIVWSGAGVGLVIYAVINHARFGSLFGVPLDAQKLVATDPLRSVALEANDGSLFGIHYSPSVLVQMLRPDAFSLRRVFPYVGFPSFRPTEVGSAVFAERDWSASLVTTNLLGVVLCATTCVVLVRAVVLSRRSSREPERRTTRDRIAEENLALARPWLVPVMGAAVGGGAIVVFGYMAQRYLLDLFPLLAIGSALGMGLVLQTFDRDTRAPVVQHRRYKMFAAFTVAAAASGLWFNSAIALQYQREIAPGRPAVDRIGWLSLQERLPGTVDPGRVADIGAIGPGDEIGRIAVVGRCELMYRSSGSGWYPLEVGDARFGARILVRGLTDGARIRVLEGWAPSGAGDTEESTGTLDLAMDHGVARFDVSRGIFDAPEFDPLAHRPAGGSSGDGDQDALVVDVVLDPVNHVLQVIDPFRRDQLLVADNGIADASRVSVTTSAATGPTVEAVGGRPTAPVCVRSITDTREG